MKSHEQCLMSYSAEKKLKLILKLIDIFPVHSFKGELAKAFRVTARLHAVTVLNRNSASDDKPKESFMSHHDPAVLHL